MSRAVRSFLRTGRIGRSDPNELAAACGRHILLQAQNSISKALPLAQRFVKVSREHGRPLLSTALRALGWIDLDRGKFADAAREYLEARRLLQREPLDRARVDRTLIDVYMRLGDMPEAHHRARLAVATFKRLGAEVDLAKTRINFANLYHRQDKHLVAARQYEKASEVLERHGDEVGLAFCRYNLANVRVQLFDLETAERLYSQAGGSFRKHKYLHYATECAYGLAWLHMLRGDFHVALSELADCEQQFKKSGRSTWSMLCQLDRAETYLSLNLFSDALQTARDAESQARRLGMRYEGAKASLFRAKAAYGLGRRADAKRAVAQAGSGFRADGNAGFLAAAELAEVQMSERGGRVNMRSLNRTRRRFAGAQLPLWEAICDLYMMVVKPQDNHIVQRLRRNPAVRAVPHLYAQWQTLLGDRQMNRGKTRLAREHWAMAADTLDAVRAKLPPADLQAAFMIGRSDPYLNLARSFETTDAARAAVWAERHRTSGQWSTSVNLGESEGRHRVRDSLADLAQRVAAISARISNKSGLRRAELTAGHRELAKLQKQVRLALCAVRNDAQVSDYDVEHLRNEFARVSSSRPVIQFAADGDDLIAFIHSDGSVRTHRYENGQRMLRHHLGGWQVLMSRVLRQSDASPNDLEDERRLFDRFGNWLWSPLEIAADAPELLIIPTSRTSNLPWSALRVGGEYLSDRHAFVLNPSLRHYIHACRPARLSSRAQLFIGNTDGLEQCRDEIEVFRSEAGLSVTVHQSFRRTDLPHGCKDKIWHYTGHANLRADNPFYSSLVLEDGPLFAADFRTTRNRVGLVTLAACRTGQQTYLPGEESSGLVRSLLEMGASSVLASHWAVSDRATAAWMRTFYSRYLKNNNLYESIRTANQTLRETYPAAYHWAAFSLHGAGQQQ